MSEQWYLSRQGEQYGPYKWEEIVNYARSGNISQTDLLWNQAVGEWFPAGRVNGLFPAAPSPAVAAVTPARSPRPAKRNRRKGLLIVGSSVLAVSLLVVAIFNLFPVGTRGDEPDLPAMPPIEIEHESGARLNAPEGAFIEDTPLTISTRENGPSAEPYERVGPAYEVNGISLDVGRQPVTLDLPVGQAGEHAVAMFYSLGQWIIIPSTPVELASGEAALQVQIDAVPFPWVLTVAEQPEELAGLPALVEGDEPEAILARAEQLMITDHDAFLAEINKLESLDNLQGSTGHKLDVLGLLPFSSVAYASESESSPSLYSQAFAYLNAAKIEFLSARRSGFKYRTSDPHTATQHYMKGLHYLWEARRLVQALEPAEQSRWFRDHDKVGEDIDRLQGDRFGPRRRPDQVYGGSTTIQNMVEYYCGTFAPWGLELIIEMLEHNNRELLQNFDIRVLPFYGQLPFVSMSFPGVNEGAGFDAYTLSACNTELKARMASDLGIIQGNEVHYDQIHIYSPRLYEWSSSEIFSMISNADTGVSAILGLATLATGTGGVGVMAVAAFNVAMPFIEYFVINPLAEERARAAVRSNIPISLFKGGKMVASNIISGRPPTDFRSATDIVMNLMIDHVEIAQTSMYREAGSSTAGYRNASAWWWNRFPVPPIFLLTTVSGPTGDRPHSHHPDENMRPGPEGSYMFIGHGMKKQQLNYRAVGLDVLNINPYDLSEMYRQGVSNELNRNYQATNDFFQTFLHYLQPFQRWTPLSFKHYDTAPDIQRARWSIEWDRLVHWAEAADMENVGELLENVTVEVYVDSASPEPLQPRGFFSDETAGEENLLKWHVHPTTEADGLTKRDGKDVFLFNLDILSERKPFGENTMIKEWEERSSVMIYRPVYVRKDGYAALSYEIRLLLGEEVLASYQVNFGDRATDIETTLSIFGETIEESWVVESSGECAGTYEGKVNIADPSLAQMGLGSMEMKLTIIIDDDGQAEMTFSYGDSFSFDLGEGYSLSQSWEGEANLTGQCVDGEIQLQGTQVTRIDMKMPDEAFNEEIPSGALDQIDQVIVSARLQNDVIEGTISWEEGVRGSTGTGASDLAFTAKKVD